MADTVTIPRTEYDRRCAAADDLADMGAARAVRARIEAGDEEPVPAAVADRLIDDENPLEVWREHRGMTRSGLARASRANRVQIADIEAGRTTGSIRIVRALAIHLDDLGPARSRQ